MIQSLRDKEKTQIFTTSALKLDPDMLCFEKPGTFYNRYLYPITFPSSEQRDLMAAYLLSRNIGAIQPYKDIADIAVAHYGYEGGCPVAEEVARRVLVIPSNYSVSKEDLHRIAQCVNEGWEEIKNRGRGAVCNTLQYS